MAIETSLTSTWLTTSGILLPECTKYNVPATSKKSVLEAIANIAAQVVQGMDAQLILSGLIERESLGSTGLAHGVAVPHCRCSVDQPYAILIRLENPIPYEAPDDEGVDLFFALLMPHDADDMHIQCLSQVTKALHQPGNRALLRRATSDEALYEAARQCL